MTAYEPEQVEAARGKGGVVHGPPCPATGCGGTTVYRKSGQGWYDCPRCRGGGVYCNVEMHQTNWPGKAYGDPTCFGTWIRWVPPGR
jgi:hypothetical protein